MTTPRKSTKRSKLGSELRALRLKAVADYRRRIRRWTMECLPTMPEGQWNAFMRWVSDWGRQDSPLAAQADAAYTKALQGLRDMGEAGNSRIVIAYAAERDAARVTAPVTAQGPIGRRRTQAARLANQRNLLGKKGGAK
jgi:hypothetical protein